MITCTGFRILAAKDGGYLVLRDNFGGSASPTEVMFAGPLAEALAYIARKFTDGGKS